MPSRPDGISPQNKIDNNVSTTLNAFVILYRKKLFLKINNSSKLQIKILHVKDFIKIYHVLWG